MAELTAKQLEVIHAHAAAEFANDVEATMATVCENPWYELVGLGLLLEGREAVREWYRRSLPAMTEREVVGEPRVDGIAPDTMMSEYYVCVTVGGVVTKCRCLAVISLEGDLFKGERIYSDPFLSELWAKDLGDDFDKVPGVTRV